MKKQLINKSLHYGIAYLFLFFPIMVIGERPSLTLKVLDVFVIFMYCLLVIYFYEMKYPQHLIPWVLLMMCIVYFSVMMNIGCIMFFMFPAYALPMVIRERLNSLHGYIMVTALMLVIAAAVIVDIQNSWIAFLYAVFLLIVFFVNDRAAYLNNKKEITHQKDKELARLSKEIERNRISQDLHDSLGQVFSILAVKSELALKMMQLSPEAAEKELKEINELSKSSLLKVREIVEEVKTESVTSELMQSQQLLISAWIRMDYKMTNWQHDEDERNVVMLLKELVNNVYKHSQADHVVVELKEEGLNKRIVFKDNGIGPQSPDITLRSIEERVEKLHGYLNFKNIHPGLLIEIEWSEQE